MSGREPARRGSLWRRIRSLLGGRGSAAQPPPPEPPPDEEDALVPSGPPRRPRPASGVEVELPTAADDAGDATR